MGKFRSQSLPGAPTVVLDVVVTEIAQDTERAFNEDTKRWESGARKGRILGVQTAGVDPDRVPELQAIKVPLAFDDVTFDLDRRYLVNVEMFEWAQINRQGEATGGASFRFVSLVDPGQFDAWKGVVTSQRQGAAA